MIADFSSQRTIAYCAVLFCFVPGTICTAQSGQVIPSNGSSRITQSNLTRSNPAPWRPQVGTIARQAQSTPGTIPPRQSLQNPQQRLPIPNSPQSNSRVPQNNSTAPTGINLQTGSSTLPSAGLALPNTPLSNVQSPATVNNNRSSAGATGRSTTDGQFVEPNEQPLPRGVITRVTKSMTRLPNDAGQVWREYDISPYTSRVIGIPDPQQAILDWVLKETGTEMWFNQPLGILNADRNQLRVYHTPEIQERVHRIVDRFVHTKGQIQNIEVSLVTIGKPNWRSSAYPILQPIDVQSPGVEAWMVTKENAALLRASLARRGDYKDHGTGRIATNDGQSVVLRNTRPVQFIRNFRWTGNQIPPYQPLITTIDEGYTLEISSLTSLDGNTIEAAVACHVDQVEKLNTVKVDVPGSIGATTEKISLQIPQLVSWRLKERFRWQNDQVLLLSCGVVATPGPQNSLPVNLPNFLGSNRQRADALLFIEYRGPELETGNPANTARNRTVPVDPRR